MIVQSYWHHYTQSYRCNYKAAYTFWWWRTSGRREGTAERMTKQNKLPSIFFFCKKEFIDLWVKYQWNQSAAVIFEDLQQVSISACFHVGHHTHSSGNLKLTPLDVQRGLICESSEQWVRGSDELVSHLTRKDLTSEMTGTGAAKTESAPGRNWAQRQVD